MKMKINITSVIRDGENYVKNSYNKAEIIIAKQRHGPIGSIKAHFDPNFTRFSDLTTTEYDNIME